ncbi:hypothetical protein EJ05DRAFT_336520 [Pseudovirgaria hyperparasitica]|uniref:Uncharacterized protein n=1 Tax=Pseudovirgaria hyperparasitica TaxID=470096 RepID=A0A6A6W952_9PEZI|nr:uncharacterized protein EJ05DRAFT_336520 [Pseudovirgaria hyperparasitica]KAF2759193.1 hypothetical protein EJ05DRAFT_336520 [Pseudovirgaria hyperparasitica]
MIRQQSMSGVVILNAGLPHSLVHGDCCHRMLSLVRLGCIPHNPSPVSLPQSNDRAETNQTTPRPIHNVLNVYHIKPCRAENHRSAALTFDRPLANRPSRYRLGSHKAGCLFLLTHHSTCLTPLLRICIAYPAPWVSNQT